MTVARQTRAVLVGALLVSVGLSAKHFDQASPTGQPARPTYESATGPVISFDETHKNTTTYARYPALVQLLKDDGYRPRPLTQPISGAALADVGVLVIVDPAVSLSADEVSATVAWLKGGGSVVMVVDHYPLVNAKLTAALGVPSWPEGAAVVRTDLCKPEVRSPPCTPPDPNGNQSAMNIFFWRTDFSPGGEPMLAQAGSGGGLAYQSADAVLAKHAITEGRAPSERIRRVVTFSGSAFQAFPGAQILMTLPRLSVLLGSNSGTPIEGWLQGAVVEFERGRLALFADSGVLSGGVAADKNQFIDNRQFVLNLMHWLSRVL